MPAFSPDTVHRDVEELQSSTRRVPLKFTSVRQVEVKARRESGQHYYYYYQRYGYSYGDEKSNQAAG